MPSPRSGRSSSGRSQRPGEAHLELHLDGPRPEAGRNSSPGTRPSRTPHHPRCRTPRASGRGRLRASCAAAPPRPCCPARSKRRQLLIQSAHGRSEGEAVRGAEPPHLIGGMLPVEQPMGVLQGECRLADAPQADQGLGDHDWAHKGRTWKGAGCAPFTGRVEELAWLRQAAGVPQRRKDSTSQPLLRVAGPRHGAGRRVCLLTTEAQARRGRGLSVASRESRLRRRNYAKRRYSSINPRSSRRSRPSRALLSDHSPTRPTVTQRETDGRRVTIGSFDDRMLEVLRRNSIL